MNEVATFGDTLNKENFGEQLRNYYWNTLNYIQFQMKAWSSLWTYKGDLRE